MNKSAHSAPSTETRRKSKGRGKYLFIGILVFAIIAGWSAFWMISRNKTQELIDQLMAVEINGIPILSCANQSLGGYPFRLVLFCSAFEIHDARSGWLLAGGPLRSVWQVYAPNLAIIETEGRAVASHRPTGQSFEIASPLIRASIRFDTSARIARASIAADQPSLTSNDPLVSRTLGKLEAKQLELHARPNPNNADDLDLSANLTDLAWPGSPYISGSFGFTAIGGLDEAIQTSSDPARSWLEQSGQISAIASQLIIGQKTLNLSGDIMFNDQGYANGRLGLKIFNPRPEDTDAGKELTARRDGFNGPLTALQLLGRPISEGNLVGSLVPITLENGNIKAGFLQLGKIPAVR